MILSKYVEFLENQLWYGPIDEPLRTSSKLPIMGKEDAGEKQEARVYFQGNFGEDWDGRKKGKQPQSFARHNRAATVLSSSKHDRASVLSNREDWVSKKSSNRSEESNPTLSSLFPRNTKMKGMKMNLKRVWILHYFLIVIQCTLKKVLRRRNGVRPWMRR